MDYIVEALAVRQSPPDRMRGCFVAVSGVAGLGNAASQRIALREEDGIWRLQAERVRRQ